MAHRESRPPRSQPPRSSTGPQSYASNPPSASYQPGYPQYPASNSITFQETERGDRTAPLSPSAGRFNPQYFPENVPNTPTNLMQAEEGGSGFAGNVARKKSLVKPDRGRVEPGHRHYHYHNQAVKVDNGNSRIGLMPSTTGNYPAQAPDGGLRRGKSLLAREQDVPESGLALFARGATLRRKRPQSAMPTPSNSNGPIAEEPQPKKRLCFNGPGPNDWFMMYCYIITFCIPPFLLSSCGIKTPEQQRAWREKMGLLAVIGVLMAAVGFLTFGFTQVVCPAPPLRFRTGTINTGNIIVHGFAYDFTHFQHPAVAGVFTGKSNPLYEGGYKVAGYDASFMFQTVNQNCRDWIKPANGTSITVTNGNMGWYFPCNAFNPNGTAVVDISGYDSPKTCHLTSGARQQFAKKQPSGQVYFTWDDVKKPDRNLAVYQSNVLDLSLLNWLDKSQVTFPPIFNDLKTANGTFNGRDITMYILRTKQKKLAACLQDTVTVGFIDAQSIGCVASSVVLYLSLIFIIGVVMIRFSMAVIFGWFVSWQLGAFKGESYEQRMQRAAAIEQWTDDIYRPAPSRYRPSVQNQGAGAGKGGGGNRKTQFFPTTSRFSKMEGGRVPTTYGAPDVGYKRNTTSIYSGAGGGGKLLTPDSATPTGRGSRSTSSLFDSNGGRSANDSNPCPFPLARGVIPQPPPEYEPFNFPLAHTICLVTAYSEGAEAMRTTLDSLATTDYPNSHKVILVIADGMVKGHGNILTTPDIVLSMMKDFVVEPEDVQPHSYVAIADGHKRHNQARVYAGFYAYDNTSVEPSKQQRVPIVLVAKCGNKLEQSDPKPGNRGKRDSQIVLMAFLEKVMFDERMTTFEYEFFNSLWRVTGVCPDRYEMVLCVDADTKAFPDSLTRMVACMVDDVEIMGLCGETKIANKAESWVTMIQVFEYYISHHLTKAFESMFGGVTCLPGCFSMYRIKTPKGSSDYWVPILANPDVVEHYSENIVDTLHKKNLLLLGEDRYLSTLMLKTFPKRKMIFCPQAVCKTIVPDTFSVLLSQRRRWINSTIHNLAELLLVRDLCGTFCFSMQFVVFIDLAGTLVLPAAITFTFYLIIRSIIPHHSNTTIPLILLGIILGLPGLLIVLTSRKIAYVGWMLVYLLSLPVWNFILPAYAFWHFDDFSWGQTRQVAGDKGGHHGDKEGEFDSSHIIMKRWSEFERERRTKSGITSRDSLYYDVVPQNTRRPESRRFSSGSTAETQGISGGGDSSENSLLSPPTSRLRHDSTTLMLPAPLAISHPSVVPVTGRGGSPVSTASANRSQSRSMDAETIHSSGHESATRQRLISPTSGYGYEDAMNRPLPASPADYMSSSQASMPMAGVGAGSARAYPGEPSSTNPYRFSQPQPPLSFAGYDSTNNGNGSDDEFPMRRSQSGHGHGLPNPTRGVSLSDNGPVPSSDGVRRVQRKRPTSSQPPTTGPQGGQGGQGQGQGRRSSRNSAASPTSGSDHQGYGPPLSHLPPGAAAPRPQDYSRFQ